jgi:hypothetical protein
MLTTPHLLIGAAVGAQLHNPILIAPVAVGSHFIFDSVPHLMGFIEVEDLDKKDIVFVASDVLLGLLILAFLTFNNPKAELIWLGAFCSVLPDFHHTFQVLFGPDKLQKYTKAHLKFHYKKPIKLLPGIATQVVTVLIALVLIVFHR